MATREEMIATLSGGEPTRQHMIDSLAGKWGNVQEQVRPLVDKIPEAMKSMQDKMIAETTPEGRAEAAGPSAVKRYEEASKMDMYNKFMINLGQQTDKMLTGTQDLFGDMTMGNLDFIQTPGLEYKDGKYRIIPSEDMPTAIDRRLANKVDQENKDRMFAQMMDASPIMNPIAGAIVEAPLEIMGLPIAKHGAKVAMDKLSEFVTPVVEKVGSVAKDSVKQAIKKDYFGAKKVNEEWVEPIVKMAKSYKAKSKNPIRNSRIDMADLAAGTTLGTISGAMDYDKTVGEGALTGLVSSMSGQALRPFLARTPNRLGDTDKEVMEFADEIGYRAPPGMLRNDKQAQRFESALRSDRSTSNIISDIDDANRRAMNIEAYKAMGVPANEVSDMTPALFKKHADSLKDEYEEVVSGTKAVFDKDQWDKLLKVANTLKVEGNANIVSDVEQIMGNLKRSTKSTGGVDILTGRSKPWTFSGEDFQRARSLVKSKLNKAHYNGDKETMKALSPMLEELDRAVNRGVVSGGKYSAKKWKDINEKYAMYKLLIKDGMDLSGNLDLDKLSKNFESKDMERLLTGQGGRVKPLHMLAKLGKIEKSQYSPDQYGLGLSDSVNPMTSMLRKMSPQRPLSGLDEFYTGKYWKDKMPRSRGMLRMEREGIWSPTSMSRIFGQSTQSLPTIYDKGNEAIDSLLEWYEDQQ